MATHAASPHNKQNAPALKTASLLGFPKDCIAPDPVTGITILRFDERVTGLFVYSRSGLRHTHAA